MLKGKPFKIKIRVITIGGTVIVAAFSFYLKFKNQGFISQKNGLPYKIRVLSAGPHAHQAKLKSYPQNEKTLCLS
ncbi:hypothetical protein PZE06_12815 [Robertmurraya sp. DFI.2.37]|uniref:hypothetical protein n=1 Tax=Robertmurraya sp. DFI.2.37 TaxID=3031819 RepID=UPI001245EF79|nr:hypothetical protein [Robertmurraya sp. DFI.2.37]MDF1509053.1 hypothetical protein [Robertmurraya sp. DFI.2.37]